MRLLRRFVVRVTGSGTDPFRSARWKLTLVYVGILTAIVALLSAALYELHAHDVRGIEERRSRPSLDSVPRREGVVVVQEPPSVGEYLETLGRSIIWADILTIVAGGALSALLADRTLRPIREAVESEKAFYANAAHDLRTPLAVMRSEAEVALRSGTVSGEDARQLITSSLEEIGHMSAMVEQMLDLARSGRQRRAGALRRLDLSAIARDAAARMATRAEERGVHLGVEADEEAPVRGDSLSLQRALGNVLENALAYTPRGGSVVIRVQRTGLHIDLVVEDTGIGITPADLPRITEPFFRGDRARTVHAGGSGLGLTIVKSTMEDHGGTLKAASRAGAGTSITLRFPATRDAPPP